MRERRIPYIAVDEARKTLLPAADPCIESSHHGRAESLKSFDFVIHAEGANLLVDVKGRRIPRARSPLVGRGRLESWVTRDDVESMLQWERLFGPGFEAAFLFLYWCDGQPPDALFHEVFEDHARWYAIRAVRVAAYAERMRIRSPRWGTVDLSTEDFERLAEPFFAAVAA